MPFKCTVLGCPRKEVKDTFSLSTRKFPFHNSALVKKWLEKVDLTEELSSSSRVCDLHFAVSSFVETATGKTLKPDAVPLEYLANGKKIIVKSFPKNRQYAMISKAEQERDAMENFEKFNELLRLDNDNFKQITENWNLLEKPEGVCFYRVSPDEFFDNIKFSFKVLVKQNMQVNLFRGEVEADAKELNWILSDSKLERWSQLRRILKYYQAEPPIVEKPNCDYLLRKALESLKQIKKSTETENMIESIKAQINIAIKKTSHQTDFVVVKTEPEDEFSNVMEAEEVFPANEDTLKVEIKEEDNVVMVLDEVQGDFVMKNEDFSNNFAGVISDDDSDNLPDIHDEFFKTLPVKKEKKKKKKKTEPKQEKVEKEVTLIDCEHCDRKQMTKLQYRSHFYSKHNPVWCDQCGKKFNGRRFLYGHMLTHQANSKVKCPHCEITLMPGSLDRHIKTIHQGLKMHCCEVCGNRYTTKITLQAHMKKHVQMENSDGATRSYQNSLTTFHCKKCDKVLHRGGLVFEAHIANCNGVYIPKRNPVKHYQCFICERKFMSKIVAADHMAQKHNHIIDRPEKMCFICQKEVEDIVMHSRQHNCPFVCSYCGQRFITNEKLDKHFKDRHENSNRPFQCDLCTCSFKNMNHLRSHIQHMHTTAEERKFECEICDRRYAYRHQLTAHIQSAHEKGEKFPCNFCDMRFTKLSLMKFHCLRIHGETNAYPCPSCPEKLKTLNHLKRHQQESHGISINPQKYHEK